VKSRHLQGCSPHLCRLGTKGRYPRTCIEHTEQMLVIWAYYTDVAGQQQKVGFAPTASIVSLGEKLGTDPWIGQLSCCRLGQEPFFSGAVALLNSIDDFAKGCHVWGLPAGSVQVAYVDWRRKHMCHLHQVFPVGCTSI
jgi:hypothetical protein